MYAIVKTGGKQYKVAQNDMIEVEKLDVEVGAKIELDALLFVDENAVTAGNPVLENIRVIAEVVAQGKGVKLNMFNYKPKIRERTKQGHRQRFTALRILEISKK